MKIIEIFKIFKNSFNLNNQKNDPLTGDQFWMKKTKKRRRSRNKMDNNAGQ